MTDCPKANQGKKSHKDVEAVLMNHFNIITATKAKFFPGDKLQADIFLSGITPSTTLRLGTGTSTSRQPTLWGPPTRS